MTAVTRTTQEATMATWADATRDAAARRVARHVVLEALGAEAAWVRAVSRRGRVRVVTLHAWWEQAEATVVVEVDARGRSRVIPSGWRRRTTAAPDARWLARGHESM